MKILFTALFVLDAVLNVIACASDLQKLRRYTKVLLMPLLLGVYAFAAADFSPLVAAALICGWGGDIAMMFKADRRALAAGMAMFGVGHILYIAAMAQLFPRAPGAIAVLIAAAAAAVMGAAPYIYLRGSIPGRLRFLSLSYSILLCALAVTAVLALITGAPGALKLLAGALCFIISDSTLSLETFRLGDTPKIDFAVMLTYIAAQALLIAGFSV